MIGVEEVQQDRNRIVVSASDSARCIACGGEVEPNPWFHCGALALFRCGACGGLTSLPRPSEATLAALHDSPEYFAHDYFELRRSDDDRVEHRCRALHGRLIPHLAGMSLHEARHLDIGCDTGLFAMRFSRLYGTHPMGVDIASRAVVQATALGVEAFAGSIEAAPASLRDLDIVTAIDVIEHVGNPRSFLDAIAQRLRPGGLLYIETPNPHSAVYRIGRTLARMTGGQPSRVFERLFPSEHVQYLPRRSLEALARHSGFAVLAVEQRGLPAGEIATGLAIRIAMTLLQWPDKMTGDRILTCVVLRRA